MLWPLVLFTSAVAGQSALDSYNRALNLYRSGDLDAAIQEVRTAIDHQPIFPEAYNMLGLLLGKKGQDPARHLGSKNVR